MKKILIADNDILILYSLSKVLKNSHVDVKTVQNSKEAIDEISACFYDLCFLDLYLPLINGLDVMIKAKELSPETKIIAMSSSDISADMQKEIKISARRFLPKPFDLHDIKQIAAEEMKISDANEYVGDVLSEERRRYGRMTFSETIQCSVSVLDPGELKLKRLNLEGDIIDISNIGMSIHTMYPLKAGQMIMFNNWTKHKAGIAVQSMETDDNSKYRVGVKFI